jgi:hypothetical protein
VVRHHEELAALAWNCYRGKMGTSRGIDVCLNLSDTIQRVDGLHDITKPFTREEIDGVIAKMSCDKAPGPDGFNCMFLKKCWPIIKHGFYQLAEDIYLDKVALDSINNSYITLVPKCQIPEKINDYMPISLTNCCLKFLTKMADCRRLLWIAFTRTSMVSLRKEPFMIVWLGLLSISISAKLLVHLV